MSAHVSLNLLNELWKTDKMRGLNLLNWLRKKIRCEALSGILSVFHNEFNK